MMSWIDSRHWKMSTSHHFQNGHHNTAQIQHCPISTTFHMWVDYDVPNWFLTSKNFYQSPFSKWPPQYSTNSTLFDFNVLNWFPTEWRRTAKFLIIVDYPFLKNKRMECTNLVGPHQLLCHWFTVVFVLFCIYTPDDMFPRPIVNQSGGLFLDSLSLILRENWFEMSDLFSSLLIFTIIKTAVRWCIVILLLLLLLFFHTFLSARFLGDALIKLYETL
jgi:hypothetical protein